MESIPFKLLNVIARLDAVYLDHRPATLCILTGVSKCLNATIGEFGTTPDVDLVDYYMLSNTGNYFINDDSCGVDAAIIPYPAKITRRSYCSSLGVNWYLPRAATRSRRHMPMLTHAAVLNCCLGVFKAILYRISKTRGWQLTPQFMRAVIHNHRLDVLKYIARRYQKFPDLSNLHECVIACELDMTMFIAAIPQQVVYKLVDLPNGYRELTVTAHQFNIHDEVLTHVIDHYNHITSEMRHRYSLIVRILVDYGFIDNAMIVRLVKKAYSTVDNVELLTALLEDYHGAPFDLEFNPRLYNSNIYLYHNDNANLI